MSGELNHHVSVELNRSAGRWAVALAATAAFMVGGGYLGSVGSAQAGDKPGNNNVGSPGRDGVIVTCYADSVSPLDDTLVCNPGNGEPGAVYRLMTPLAATPSDRAPHGG